MFQTLTLPYNIKCFNTFNGKFTCNSVTYDEKKYSEIER
jgi:hypothetical protein